MDDGRVYQYYHYYITIPAPIAKELGLENGKMAYVKVVKGKVKSKLIVEFYE
jgi:bifunctional DNA-binding transcriptional regulator/antitoxin component of YhaV-PrlF toxin-antitoxin module